MSLTLSVVIPVFNRAHLIGRALRSVLRQIAPEDEIIAVDDGSMDDVESVIRQFTDSRIRYVRQAHAGAGVARNRGVAEARRDLISFLDSDDEWLPGKVELQRRFMMARPDVLFCFTDLMHKRPGQPISSRRWHTDPRSWEEIMGRPVSYSSIAPLPRDIPNFNVFIASLYRGEMHTNYLSTICVMIRRSGAGDALHFAEDTATFEDWECYGRLCGKGIAAYLDFVGAIQHAHSGARLTDANLATSAASRLTVLRRVWGADPDFLRRYQSEYDALVREQVCLHIRGLLVLGRVQDARAEIQRASDIPALYRLLATFNPKILVELLSARRSLNAGFRRLSQMWER
jgi:glycosyltransferase involved in cell wall biosynthesis